MRPRRKPQHAPTSGTKPPARNATLPPADAARELDLDEDDEDEPITESLSERLQRELVWFDRFLRRWLLRLMVFGTHLTIACIACYFIVWTIARGHSYDSVEAIPPQFCGVVLGALPKTDGRDNIFFTSRIQAAADLYKASKLQYIIVSGDNSHDGYDEPTEMKAALVAKGVPASHIYCDYAGFRTLDSVVRADRIFGQQQFTIISQAFHNPRALYIARRNGLVDCIAFNAPGADTVPTIKMHLRELAARVMAIIDVELLKKEPKFLGDKIPIGDRHPPVDAKPVAPR